jgi:hypothetical protein
LPLRFGHISEVWKFLKETLPKYQWPTEKAKVVEEEQVAVPNVNHSLLVLRVLNRK